MKKSSLLASALFAVMLLPAGVVMAADQVRDQDRLQDPTRDQLRDQDQDRIYGSQLMTDKERLEYRNRVRAAKTAEEREQIRNEHHERMKVRAKEQGKTLPDEPPNPGAGMGPGPAAGGMGGMGPGGGKR
jgi:hypothetical protein